MNLNYYDPGLGMRVLRGLIDIHTIKHEDNIIITKGRDLDQNTEEKLFPHNILTRPDFITMWQSKNIFFFFCFLCFRERVSIWLWSLAWN